MRGNIMMCALLAAALAGAEGQAEAYEGKSIYLPVELADNDFSNPDSHWSYKRMASTENIVLFWAPGFGEDIGSAPDLEGENMKVDMGNLLAKLEAFYDYFRNELKFVKEGSKADRYKMMVMLDYTLEGTAYGGAYDDEIGALWITPNRVQDRELNCIAHELGHSFQTQISCDGAGEGWGGCGFYEMASQWMLWQVNPDWQTDERYHLDAYRGQTHKAFLHIDNIYHSPYVLESWGEKEGLPFIAELFREGKVGEDPVMTYKRLTGKTQGEFCDMMYEEQARQINWDFDRVRSNAAKYANQWHTTLEEAGEGGWRPSADNCPENYGFNAIELENPGRGKRITVMFDGEAGREGYVSVNPEKAGWRYGVVTVTADGATHYGEMQRAAHGKFSYTTPKDDDVEHLWLMVMGAPTEHWRNIDGPDNPGDAQWPYRVRLKGTKPMKK